MEDVDTPVGQDLMLEKGLETTLHELFKPLGGVELKLPPREMSGNLIGSYDLLKAAHARTLGATLVTHNVKEFVCVGSLKIKDWVGNG